jgi:thiol-disulfide isomerase/thioredoxin
MNRIVAGCILMVIFTSFSNLKGQQISTYSYTELAPLLHRENDTVYLVNFWATWCVPCVKELPSIEKLADKYKNTNLKVLLVSLDMPKEMNSRLKPFLQKHQIKSEVILLDDPDFNSWIDLVNKDWSGAIPASLIYSKNKRTFYEQSFDFEELEQIVKPLIH